FTLTRPALIQDSSSRREPRPARARTFWSFSPSGACSIASARLAIVVVGCCIRRIRSADLAIRRNGGVRLLHGAAFCGILLCGVFRCGILLRGRYAQLLVHCLENLADRPQADGCGALG